MEAKVKAQECIAPGVDHDMRFVIAAHGYQCFECFLCGHMSDVVEDSQP